MKTTATKTVTLRVEDSGRLSIDGQDSHFSAYRKPYRTFPQPGAKPTIYDSKGLSEFLRDNDLGARPRGVKIGSEWAVEIEREVWVAWDHVLDIEPLAELPEAERADAHRFGKLYIYATDPDLNGAVAVEVIV